MMQQNNALSPQTTLALMQQQQSQSAQASKMDLDTLKQQENIDKTAHDFEAVFISEMIKPMFEGIETDNMFGGGKGEEVFRGMLIQEYGKVIADKDITGIQTQVKNKLIEMQAEQSANEPIAYSSVNPPSTNHRIIDTDFIEKPAPTTNTLNSTTAG